MTDWQERALCRRDPGRWLEPKVALDALHVCRYHCPVRAECRAFAAGWQWFAVVIAGEHYGFKGELNKVSKAVAVHGRWCDLFTSTSAS